MEGQVAHGGSPKPGDYGLIHRSFFDFFQAK
jgi:hypothetical protein